MVVSSKIEFTQNLDQNTLLLLLLLLLQRFTERFRCVKLCANHLLAFFNYSSRRNTFANSEFMNDETEAQKGYRCLAYATPSATFRAWI